MKLSANEKRLYWTIWGVVALVAAVWLAMRDKPTPTPAGSLRVVLDAPIKERFQSVEISKSGLDHVNADLTLTDGFAGSVHRFQKGFTIAYRLQRGELVIDRGEFMLTIGPGQKVASARFLNRKKADFDTVFLHLPH